MAIITRKREIRERTLISASDLKTISGKIVYTLIYLFLILGCISTFLPLLWGVLSALKEPTEIFSYPPRFFPKPPLEPWKWGWTNYKSAWQAINYPYYFMNTIILAIGVWFFSIFPSALAGYALSKLRLGLLKIFAFMFFATLMVPFFTILIPLYLTVKDLPIFHLNLLSPKLLGGLLAVFLPAGVNAFNIFVFRSFFNQIPNDLIEAARVDGASEFRIFLTLILPLSQSIIAVLSIFSFIGTWNDFFWPWLVLQPNRWTISIKLYDFARGATISWNIILAALMLAAIPPIIIFLIFQKRIIQGIASTGLKF